MERRFEFTFPRQPSGRVKVQVIEQTQQDDGSWSWDLYPLKDEAGQVREFDNHAEAWLAAKAWQAQQAGGD